jgi:hypothetical protein
LLRSNISHSSSGGSGSSSGEAVMGFKRRAAVSRWLQSAVKPEVEAALHTLLQQQQQQQGGSGGPSGTSSAVTASPMVGSSSVGRSQQQQQQGASLLWAVLQLLAGHQVGKGDKRGVWQGASHCHTRTLISAAS